MIWKHDKWVKLATKEVGSNLTIGQLIWVKKSPIVNKKSPNSK